MEKPSGEPSYLSFAITRSNFELKITCTKRITQSYRKAPGGHTECLKTNVPAEPIKPVYRIKLVLLGKRLNSPTNWWTSVLQNVKNKKKWNLVKNGNRILGGTSSDKVLDLDEPYPATP